MTLSENSFAVLGTAPTDDRRTLTEKADEAALIGGEDTEAALNQLMQMNRRIVAEISWFPGATRQATEAFLDYSRQIAAGKPAVIPPMDGLGTALAQANALNALFEIWPADDPELFIGLCRAIDRILIQIKADDVLEAINADRKAGKWELIQDVHEIEEPLYAHIRELCHPSVKAAEKMDAGTLAPVLKKLFETEGFDLGGDISQALRAVHSAKIHETAEKKKKEIFDEIGHYAKQSLITIHDLSGIQQLAESWCSLTAPLRSAPGTVKNDARAMGFALRSIVVDFVNKANTTTKRRTVTIHKISGPSTVVITYHSKRDAIDKALDFTQSLMKMFPEQTELLEKLREDREQLNKIIHEEEVLLHKSELDVKQKYHSLY